ncbi:MAG: glycosyltransferase [Cyclobacteriaceae bacterium]
MSRPLVSVLMPVYNASPFLKDSVESILSQTFSDFEFLIINDGSTDDSGAIIDSYKDTRVLHHQMARNKGIISALNYGLSKVRGTLIARMDADDIALPTRLAEQIDFMRSCADVGVSGTWVEYFGERDGLMKAPAHHEEIVWAMLFGCPLFHPTVIMRSDLILQSKLQYSAKYPHSEDYGLWVELVGQTKFANLPKPLLKYRFSNGSVSQTFKKQQMEVSEALKRHLHDKLIGRSLLDVEWEMINPEGNGAVNVKKVMWIYESLNRQSQLFQRESFRKKVLLRMKQLILTRGVDLNGRLALLNYIIYDLRILKYLFHQS